MKEVIIREFGFDPEQVVLTPIGEGLINTTWKLHTKNDVYILQRINDNVFRNPENIDHNVQLVANYLGQYYPDYFFVSPISSKKGETIVYNVNDGYYRLLPFVKKSYTKNVVESPKQAYEAAKQFGRFTRNLATFNVNDLRITIDSFHDLSLRYTQFLAAISTVQQKRKAAAATLIDDLVKCSFIKDEFEGIKKNPSFKLRVTHHDTKISNVLFDSFDKGICVIDLDTIMPGYFFSDIGDMMRTYLSPVNEEEADFTKIEIRDEFYYSLVKGYVDEMKDELTAIEKQHIFYSGTFMTYMQALRFLTDYLNGDIYYPVKYPEHNLNRAKNQTELLQKMLLKRSVLEGYIPF